MAKRVEQPEQVDQPLPARLPVETAVRHQAGLDAVSREQPRLVILDVGLPGAIDGSELVGLCVAARETTERIAALNRQRAGAGERKTNQSR